MRALALLSFMSVPLAGCSQAEPAAQASPAPPASISAAPAPVAAPVASAVPATVAPVPAPPVAEGPRVYAKTRFVWIYGEPNAERQWIGFLRSGNSVPLRSTKPLAGPGCGAFYAIEPQGYVCADGRRATLDL